MKTSSGGELSPGSSPLWETIVGQGAAVTLLRRAIATDRVAHAYAFIGPPGVGRRLTALAFSQACLCPDGGCGGCGVCRRVAALLHPDCRVVGPVPSKDNPRSAPALRIDQVREIAHWAALAPLEGRRKVFIVDDADRMTPPTAHALLKTLEEPPPRTLLILVVANPRALPATVLSRCQPVRFRPLGEAEVAALLTARGADPEAAGLLARLSGGQVGLAVGTDLDAVRGTRAAALALLGVPPARLAARLDQVAPDRAGVAGVLATYWLWYRDAVCLAAGADPALVINADRLGELAALARQVPLPALLSGLGTIKEAHLAVEGNVNPRLALEHTLLALGTAKGATGIRAGALAR